MVGCKVRPEILDTFAHARLFPCHSLDLKCTPSMRPSMTILTTATVYPLLFHTAAATNFLQTMLT